MARELIILECTECKRRNYTSMKEKRNTPERLEKKKYCKFERKHTIHKETRWALKFALWLRQESSSVG